MVSRPFCSSVLLSVGIVVFFFFITFFFLECSSFRVVLKENQKGNHHFGSPLKNKPAQIEHHHYFGDLQKETAQHGKKQKTDKSTILIHLGSQQKSRHTRLRGHQDLRAAGPLQGPDCGASGHGQGRSGARRLRSFRFLSALAGRPWGCSSAPKWRHKL